MCIPFITTLKPEENRKCWETIEMEWFYARRRGPEWKQGWTDQTLSSISAPPLPLMAIFAIVIFLLSLSNYNAYKEQMHYTMINFKILLFLVPVLLIIFMHSSLLNTGGWLNFRSSSPPRLRMRQELARGISGFPWAVAVLVAVLLVLVSYQSSFQSK
ncbi:UNVERIFIED_CONTAM: hypothetical protein Sangu_1073900 [Sesamum angustifolium]|uniref:Uncharacterized protein n=1 Tax=Sesamum angustifolium TaxID=2727405 RepID=A0AAW2P1F9_9LAMI